MPTCLRLRRRHCQLSSTSGKKFCGCAEMCISMHTTSVKKKLAYLPPNFSQTSIKNGMMFSDLQLSSGILCLPQFLIFPWGLLLLYTESP